MEHMSEVAARPVAAGWFRVVLATASVAAGVIHLAMVPSHAGESMLEGAGFAAYGWAQLLVAVWLVWRPKAAAIPAAIVNLSALGWWAWSRTTGMPFGAHPDAVEAVTAVDGLCAGFAAAAGIGSLLLAVAPALGRRVTSIGNGVAGAVAAGALLSTSLVLTSPTARDHGESHEHTEAILVTDATGANVATGAATPASSDTAHDHAIASVAAAPVGWGDRCDAGFNPVGFWTQAASGATNEVEGSPELDDLIAATTEPGGGEAKDARVVVKLAHVSDEVYENWLAWLPTYTAAAHGTSVSVDDNGGHGGHLGPQTWQPMTDPAQCSALQSELDRARAVALQYPTAADATAGGWVRVTGYVPGIAAHYMNFRYVDGSFDIEHPEMLLYDGDGPEASMVGLSYYLLHESDYEPTQGFTGPNDHFHRHIGLCVGAGGVIGDSTTTAEECAARGGTKQSSTGGWMNHVWVIPGCESPWGLFSGASPLLEDTLATVSGTDGGGCAGSSVRDRYDLGER